MNSAGLKLLIVARYADRRGGADVYTEALATHLAAVGHEVEVLCHAASPKVHAVCRVTEAVEPNFGDTRALWRLAPLLYRRHWRHELNRLETSTPDAIITSLPLSAGDLQKRFPKTPWVYLPHSRIAPIEATDVESKSRVQRSITRRLYSKWERWSLLNAATTVRFTAGNERELRVYYNLPAETNFRIIQAPVEFTDSERRQEIGTPLRLVSVGRLVESKNLLWMLHQLAALKLENWHWTITGDGPQRSELQQTAKDLGVADRVTFSGFCEEIGMVYQTADLHLFPSRRESLGLVILEAMAFGVSTLAFRPDGQHFQTASDEVIEHDVDGLLATDEADFRHQLNECLTRPQPLLALGEAGRQKVLQHHSWDQVAAEWQEILFQLVEQSTAMHPSEVAHA